MATGYTPEELGLVPPKETKGYTPEELGLTPAKETKPTPEKGQGYTPAELGLAKPDSLGRFIANPQEQKQDAEYEKIKQDYAISSEMGLPEYTARLFKRAGKEASVGWQQGVGGVKTFAHDLLGIDDTENKENLDRLNKVTEAIGAPESHAARIIEGAVSSIAQQLPLLGVSVVTGSEIPVLGGMFLQSFGQTYDDGKRNGLDMKDNLIRSSAFGALEVVGEKFGLGEELKGIKAAAKGVPTSEIIGHFAKALAKEIPGEELTYAGQFAVDKGYGMNPEAGLKEFLEGAVDTFAGTVVQGGMMMGAGAGVNKAVGALNRRGEQNEQPTQPGAGPIPGTNQLGLPLSSTQGETTGGAGAVDQTGLGVSGQGAGTINGREADVYYKLEDINAQINTLEDHKKEIQDPNDPQINAINQEIASLQQAKKDIDKPAPPPPKEKKGRGLNAPGIPEKPDLSYYDVATPEELAALERKKSMGTLLQGIKQETPTLANSPEVSGENWPKDGDILTPNAELRASDAEKGVERKFRVDATRVKYGMPVIYGNWVDAKTLKPLAVFPMDRKDVIKGKRVPSMDRGYVGTFEETKTLPKKIKALNAPEQFDLGLGEPVEQQAPIEKIADEFGLTAPEGKVGVTGEAAPIETPQYPTSKFMFANTGVNPVKNLVSFFKTLKPTAETEDEVKSHQAEIDKVIEKIDDFHEGSKGLDRAKRIQFLNNFFDQYSTAPKNKQNEISRLPSALAGMTAKQQQTTLKDISQFPALNTVRGMKEFNKQLDQATLDYTEAKLGRSRENAILPWQGNEDVTDAKDISELQRLGNISEKYKTPEEKAATNYLTSHADYGAPFASAMRAAAFDLGAEQGPVFPGQTKETAQQFRNWVAQNLSPATLARFDATVDEFRQLGEKISKRNAEEQASEGKGVISGKATGKAKGAGMGLLMHPSVENRIAANDLQGALRYLSKLGTPWQKGLARRLMDLGLTTNIGFDLHEGFAKRLIERSVGAERFELMSMLKGSFPSVFNEHFSNLDDIPATLKALTDLKNGKLGVPKETVDANIGTIESVRETYEAAEAVLNASGTYFPHLDSLTLNRNRGGNRPYTFLHEVLHAATHWALDPLNYDKLSAQQKQAVDEIQRTYAIAKELWKTGNEISSIDEFVVEVFTNPEFQNFLKEIPLPNQKQTIWNKFTDLIKSVFGLNNMLGYTMANVNAIMQAPPNLSTEARVLNAQGKLGGYILDDTFKAGPSARSFINDIFGGKEGWDNIKEGMPAFLESLKDSSRKYLLGGLTLRQLQDVVGPRVPPFKMFIDRMEGMLDERNASLNKVRDIVKPWQDWQSKNKEKSKILNALMLDSTRLGIDPETNTSDARLNKAWNDIGKDGQEHYIKVRDFYKNQLESHIKVLLDRKKANLVGKGLTEAQAEASQEYKDLEQHFRKNTVEPYFPLRRFGQYWLQIGEGKSKEFYTFESALERNIFKLKNQARVKSQGKKIEAGNGIRNLLSSNVQDFEFLGKLKDLIENETGNTRKELKDNIIDAVEQMYLQTLPDQSIRKMFMNRQGIQGMSQDMLRAFTASAFRISYQQSRLKYSDKLYGAVDSAEKYIDGMDPDEKKVYGDYIGELEKRLQYIMNPPDTGKLPGFLSNVSFLWYMTSPASAVVNMLGVPAMGIPIVGARYGNGKTAALMTDYARKFATTGFKDAAGKWAFPSFSNKPGMFNARQQKAFDQFVADGLIDITLTHDIVGLSETPSNLYTGRMQKVMQVLSAAFHGAEKFNREVVAMSAFDLAYERAKQNGLSEDAAVKKAIDEAKELTYKSMFDYSALNKPRFFQPAYAKVFLQFKQFSQQMTYMLARSAYEGFMHKFDANEREDIGKQINATRINDGQEMLEGKELEAAIVKYIKDFRNEGQKRLFGTLGTTFIFAGATGLPGWAALSSLMEMLHYAFADPEDEDKPFDFDNWFKNWCAQTFGGFWGDSISRGVASQVTGIDLADRMSLNDMWFRDNRKSPDEQTAVQAYLVSLMGPTAGLLVSAAQALDQLNQGHLDRAIETASPAIIKNSLKASRLGREGATTLSGDTLIPDFSNTELAAQAIGFQPERLAQKQKANIEEKNAEQEIIKKHDMLLNLMFLAIDTEDDDLHDRVIEKIQRFNTSNPGMAITPDSLANSVKRRYKQRALTEGTGGVKLNKKLIGELGEMGAYGNPEE